MVNIYFMEINITKNFNEIYTALVNKNMTVTGIAKAMGYTSSAQLHSAVNGESMLSTKAIISLIQNVNINPSFLFLGTGNMFMTDEDDVAILKKEKGEWIQRHNEVVKVVMNLHQMIQELQKRNDDLIDITSAALKYHQDKKEKEPAAPDDPKVDDILSHYKTMIEIHDKYPAHEEIIAKKGSVKPEKK